MGFVPADAVEKVAAAVFEAGAGGIGDYEGCAFSLEGRGWFTPGPEAHPTIGQLSIPRAHARGAVGDGGSQEPGGRPSSPHIFGPSL